MRNSWAIAVVLFLAACAGAPRSEGVRAELRADHGYGGREDDSASIRRIEGDPALRAALRGPAVVALTRALGEDWGLPFDPADAPELVAWSRDAVVRAAVLDPALRPRARRLAESGILGPWSYRLGRGPLWREAPLILAALLRLDGAGPLALELGEGYGYRLSPVDVPALGKLLDGDLRRELRRPEVRSSWAGIAGAGKVSFRPAMAAAVVRLAGVEEAAPMLRRLRVEYRVLITPAGLTALAVLAAVADGSPSDLVFSSRHVELLAFLRDGPGPRATLLDLPGTLALAVAGDARVTLRWLEPSRWRRRFDDPIEVDAVVELMRDPELRRRIGEPAPPEDAGRDAALRSVRALVEATRGVAPRLAAWLDPNDAAFVGRLEDPGGSRDVLEREVLALRGDRDLALRPVTAHDESGRALPWMNRVDLLKIRALQADLARPEVAGRLVEAALTDRADRHAEHGGWLELGAEGVILWRKGVVVESRGTSGDRTHRLAERPDPRTALATWHVHAVGGRAVAGPSSGGSVNDLAAARRLGVDGVVVTLLAGRRIDVDFHDARGHVFDLGIHETP